MKCIPECGYNHKPDNIQLLRRHLEDCLTDGATSRIGKEVFIVWKDGEFTVVTKKAKKDIEFPVEVKAREAFEIENRFEQVMEPSHGRQASVSRGTISSLSGKKPELKIKPGDKSDF